MQERRARRLVARVAAAALVLGFAVAAVADEDADKDIFRRLMSEPVTLFDWGIARLDQDIAAAATRTLPNRLGYGMGRPATGTIYDWRANQITLYVSVALPRASRTRDSCTGAFRDLVADLTQGAPSGPNAAGWYLLSVFKPKAHFWGSRFEDVGGKLVERVKLEVSLMPATFEAVNGDNARVRCSGRLNAESEEIAVELGS
ncbi:MAG: hypothetical protein VW338_11630 [Rhodospirillaceae bacterium]|jgi:hypothetical protein